MSTNYKTAAARIEEALKGADGLDNWHKYGEGYGSLRSDMEKLAKDLAGSYDNPGTVVVPLVEVNGGLLLVRRKLADGYGKLALPGGYQALGETWEEAGAREVLEETGVAIRPSDLTIVGVDTVEGGKVNLIFCQAMFKVVADLKPQEDEVLEVVIAKRAPDPAEVAFPAHWARINAWFMMGRDLLFPTDNHD
jgi:ADP-ribose pyrophosphatase YjhB (NUDIX family)